MIKLGKDSMLQWKWTTKTAPNGAFYSIVTSEQEARMVAARMPKSLRETAFAGVDFKKQIALVAYLGTAPNSGFAVDIHSAEIRGKVVQVVVSRRSPGKNEFSLPVVTYPMVVKTLDRTVLPASPVTFQFVDQKSSALSQEVVEKNTALHVVKPGQTLWYIAWLNSVKVQDLVRWNNLNVNSTLIPGQTLRINH
jgi:LysM repeat protein